jgi:hypothetical protein
MEFSQGGSGDVGDNLQVRSGGVFDAGSLLDLEERASSAHPLHEPAAEDPQQTARAEILSFLVDHIWNGLSPHSSLLDRLEKAYRNWIVLIWQIRMLLS